MSVQRGILGALVALTAFEVAEGVQARSMFKRGQQEGVGVELDLPLIGRQLVHLKPPASSGASSSGETFILPADVQATRARMHKVSAGIALALGIATFFLAGLDDREEDEDDDDFDEDDEEDT